MVSKYRKRHSRDKHHKPSVSSLACLLATALKIHLVQNSLIFHEDKTNMFDDVFICDKETLVVLHKLLAGFYVSNEVNFQNYLANKFI